MLGEIKLENFEGLKNMPQKAASAWSAVENGITGVKYKPLLYSATQEVRGINHFFIAEQTLITATPERRLVKIAINEFNGAYAIIPTSINEIKFSY